MAYYLIQYDITGIQSFIFSTNKMKENIGASALVAFLFKEELREIVKNAGGAWDWENESSFDTNKITKPKIVYIGGGNALVAFPDKESAKDATSKLSKIIFEKTYNQLRLAVGTCEMSGSFQVDKDNLRKKLKECKKNYCITQPLMGMGIIRECDSDKLPAFRYIEGIYVSLPSYNKRKACKNAQQIFCPKDEKNKFEIPLEFDDLTSDTARNYIAVVHIDGNSMGKKIDAAISEENDYSKAVESLRKISIKITNSYNDTLCELFAAVCEKLENKEFRDTIGAKKINDKDCIPMRRIVANGDDITFVCNAKIGISAAIHFLKELERRGYYACAGVAIVKKAFPFYRAYELAEELCSSAKKKAKGIDENDPKSFIDFHIVTSGVMTDLEGIRKKQYEIGGKSLLSRPFAMDTISCDLLCKINSLNDKLPRNKKMALELALLTSQKEAEVALAEVKSRGHLDDVANYEQLIKYFDALEAMEFYEEI